MNMFRSARGSVTPLAAITLSLVALVAVALATGFGRPGDPTPSAGPSTPSAGPTAQPSSPPSAKPSPNPSTAPGDGTIRVPLDIATRHDVSVVIDDETDTLVDASSGRAGDGMSVRWSDAEVVNAGDSRTLRLTWVGLPLDDEVRMSISAEDGGYEIHIVQAGPYPNTDAVGFDRVLVLEFDGAVDPADVEVTFETVN